MFVGLAGWLIGCLFVWLVVCLLAWLLLLLLLLLPRPALPLRRRHYYLFYPTPFSQKFFLLFLFLSFFLFFSFLSFFLSIFSFLSFFLLVLSPLHNLTAFSSPLFPQNDLFFLSFRLSFFFFFLSFLSFSLPNCNLFELYLLTSFLLTHSTLRPHALESLIIDSLLKKIAETV